MLLYLKTCSLIIPSSMTFRRYRISKYNPELRNEWGHYSNEGEWTSISDVRSGKMSYERYEQTETAYIRAITAVIEYNGIKDLRVSDPEIYITAGDKDKLTSLELRDLPIDLQQDILKITDGMSIPLEAVPIWLRVILREIIWMRLINREFEINFGYDYYVYITSAELNAGLLAFINSLGLYVEFSEV